LELRSGKWIGDCYPHFNKTHYHIHFCISGVEIETGKSLRISKEEFKLVKEKLQEYQLEKYPELSNSVVEHGRKAKQPIKNREYQLTKRIKGLSDKSVHKRHWSIASKNLCLAATFFSELHKRDYKRMNEMAR